MHASPEIHVMLSICFNVLPFIVHGLLPNPLTDTVRVPIVKYKTKNISDKHNYRPTALASIVADVFEMSLRVKLDSFQFAFVRLSVWFLKKQSSYRLVYLCSERGN